MRKDVCNFVKRSVFLKTLGLGLIAASSISGYSAAKEKPVMNLADKFTIFEEDSLRILECQKTDVDSYRCLAKDTENKQNEYQLSALRISDLVVLRGQDSEGKESWVYSAKMEKTGISGTYRHTGMKRNAAFSLINAE